MKYALRVILTLLVLVSFGWGCVNDDEENGDEEQQSWIVLPPPEGVLPIEIRCHLMLQGTCRVVRIFLPARSYHLIHSSSSSPEEWRALAQQGFVISGPDGSLYRVFGGETLLHTMEQAFTGEPEADAQFERYDPQQEVWVPTSTIPSWAQASLQQFLSPIKIQDTQFEEGLPGKIYRISRGVMELWDQPCYPTPTPAPSATTPRPSPSAPGPSPTTTNDSAVPTQSPTEAPARSQTTRVLTITLPLQKNGPCITTHMRIPLDETGEPRWGEPFSFTLYGMTYMMAVPSDAVPLLDQAYRRMSREDFRQQLLTHVEFASQGTVAGDWSPIPHLSPDSPLLDAAQALWENRTRDGADTWVDPRCRATPSPTARPVAPGPTPPTAPADTGTTTPATDLPATTTVPSEGANTGPTPTPTLQTTATPRSTLPVRRDLAAEVLDQINRVRSEHGLPPLRLNNALRCAAEEQARYLGETGQVTHTGYDGSTPPSRAVNCGYPYQALGENLGQAPSATAMVQAWLNSPVHRANILDAEYTEAGVGVVDSPNGRFFVMVFGRR